MYLQRFMLTPQMGSGFSRVFLVNSYVSRQFPTFHLKNRRTFMLFTSHHLGTDNAHYQSLQKRRFTKQAVPLSLPNDVKYHLARIAAHISARRLRLNRERSLLQFLGHTKSRSERKERPTAVKLIKKSHFVTFDTPGSPYVYVSFSIPS